MPAPNIEIQNDSGRSDIELSQPAGETLKNFSDWLKTQPPTGRTVAEIEEQIREERDSRGE